MAAILEISNDKAVDVSKIDEAWKTYWKDGVNHHYSIKWKSSGGETSSYDFETDKSARDAAYENLVTLMKGTSNMLKDLSTDVKGFISDNRQIIYWMALIFLLDHFFFQGAFRDRLKGLAERMIGKVEKQIEEK